MKVSLWRSPSERNIWEYALYGSNKTISTINVIKSLPYIYLSLWFLQYLHFVFLKIVKILTSDSFLISYQSPLQFLFQIQGDKKLLEKIT